MRSRIVRPELFYNEFLGQEDPLATVLFVGLWCVADREGRFEWREQKLRAKIFPYREVDMSRLMQTLVNGEFVARYQHGQDAYGVILNFRRYQSINKNEALSSIPKPPPDISVHAYASTLINMHDGSRSLLEVEEEVEERGESEGGAAPKVLSGVPHFRRPDSRGNPRSPHPKFPALWFSELELKSLNTRFEKVGLRQEFREQAFANVEQWFTDATKGRKEYPKSTNHMRRVANWGVSGALKLQRESDYAKQATARLK